LSEERIEEEIVIDLNSLNESFLTAMGARIKTLLSAMFLGSYLPVRIRGTKTQFDRFAKALGAEKKYISSFNQYGLNNPATYKSRYKLDSAIKKFESDTGLIWPFK
jgi:hypothetical protein|tara:strand:- start:185 stop:502 length:318 start_codon:yes stop_codon:yes gene_type:complete